MLQFLCIKCARPSVLLQKRKRIPENAVCCVPQECSRQGSVSLQRVTAADVGVQEQQQQDAGPRAEAPRDPSCSTPEDCVMLDVDEPANTNKNAPEKGPIVVSIQLTASSDTAKVSVTAVEGISTKAGSSPAREGDENRLQSTKQEAVNIPYVPGKPSLEYKATKDAQQAWEASKEYRVPTLIKYTVEDDPRIHWQKRMAAMRCACPQEANASILNQVSVLRDICFCSCTCNAWLLLRLPCTI